METPNGNPIESILPGLPTLQHGSRVIVLYRGGVDVAHLQDVLKDRLYPPADGVKQNYDLHVAAWTGPLPRLEDVRTAFGRLDEVVEANEGTPLQPRIGLYILPYQETRLSSYTHVTGNVYVVTPGLDYLLCERLANDDTPPKVIYLHAHVPAPVTPVDTGVVDVGQLNSLLGGGAARGKTSLWLAKIHDYKTGHLVDMLWRALTRNPIPGARLRTAVFVSAENQASSLLALLHQRLRAHVDMVMEAVPRDITDEQCAYVTKHLAALGWEFLFYKTLPGDFGTMEFHAHLSRMGCVDIPLLLVDDLTVAAFKGDAVELLRQLNGVRDHWNCHLAVADNLPVAKQAIAFNQGGDDPALSRHERLVTAAVEGRYNKELAKLADHTCLLGVTNTLIPRVTYKPAGFDAGKPAVDLAIRRDRY